MNVLVLGATGGTGRLIVEQALMRSHKVTALVRDPRKMSLQDPNLRVEIGNVLAPNDLDRVVPGQDAVIFAVGPGHKKDSTVRTDGARNTVTAMTKANVKRLVAMSCLGAGVSRGNMGLVFNQILARTTLKGFLADLNGLESEIRRSKLDWVVVRPGDLVDEKPTGKLTISWDGTEISKTMPRADVVKFLLDQLEGEEYLRKPVAIGRGDLPPP